MPFRATKPTPRDATRESPKPVMNGSSSFGRLRARLRHFDGIADVRAFLRIGAALSVIPLALSTVGLQRVLIRMDATRGAPRQPEGSIPSAISIEQAQRLAVYADFWLRHLRLRNPCLRRSLVLYARLRHRGLPVIFCLGIRRGASLGAGDPVQGHAWLELDNRVILEPETVATQHVRTYRYPPSAAD